MASSLQNSGIVLSTTLAQDFDINYNSKLNELSTEFASAHPVTPRTPSPERAEYYALVFNKFFPADLEKISIYKKLREKHLQELVDYGRVQSNKGEALCCILKKPAGVKLSEILKKGRFDEQFATAHIFTQIFAGLSSMHANGIMHGGINLENVYYDQRTNNTLLKESISEFVGFSQKAVFETFERMVCDPSGKSNRELSADFYACGVLIASMVNGSEVMSGIPDDLVRKIKFENGSYDSILGISSTRTTLLFSPKNELLLKGLLHDRTKERWQVKQVSGWQRKETVAPSPSRVHRQAAQPFTFEGIEYFSPKYLAHVLHHNWGVAKKNVKLGELARWIIMTSRAADIEKRVMLMLRMNQAEVIIPDDKLARMIYLLDEDGPIRFRDVSFHPDGLGSELAYYMYKNNTSAIESISTAVDMGFIEGWISGQENQDLYRTNALGWNPKKIKMYIKKNEPGFGVERCLYELNPFLPCLSPILENTYAIGLPALLTALNQGRLNGKDIENDKHLTAYICSQIELDEPVKVKSLQNFPYFNKALPIKFAAMFAMAQQRSGIDKLPGIASWLRQNLTQVTDKLNSTKIKRKVMENLDTAAATGDVGKVFASISDPKLIKSDVYGFQEAKRQFKVLSFEIMKLKSQHNLDQLAYRMGLRVAVISAYLVCAIAIMSVLLLNF